MKARTFKQALADSVRTFIQEDLELLAELPVSEGISWEAKRITRLHTRIEVTLPDRSVRAYSVKVASTA